MESAANLLPFIRAPDPLPAPKLPVTDRLRSNPPASVPSGSRLEDRAASSKRPDAARLSLRFDVVTGGNAQAAVARSLASLLRSDQVILLIQGNTGGSLIVRRALDDAGCRAEVEVAEMDNYPYSCWRLGPTRITRACRCSRLTISAIVERLAS
jgi:hypothetical protein